MLNELWRIPDFDLFILLSCVFILTSIIAVYLVKWFIPLELRYKDAPVIGSVSALVSLIYGVLAGITALYLMNNIAFTNDAAQREANAVANIYRDSQWLPDPTRDVVRHEVKNYLSIVINDEWPLMRVGIRINNQGDTLISKLSNSLYSFTPDSPTPTQTFAVQEMIKELKVLYNARQERVHLSLSELSGEIWVVILIGTILTISINFLYGINFYLHLLAVSAAALMATSVLFVLITLDRPFQGEFAVEPDAFIAVQAQITQFPPTPT